MDASIFDPVVSHTGCSDASEKRRRKILASTFGRFRLWTSFESSPVSVKTENVKFLVGQKSAVFHEKIYF